MSWLAFVLSRHLKSAVNAGAEAVEFPTAVVWRMPGGEIITGRQQQGAAAAGKGARAAGQIV